MSFHLHAKVVSDLLSTIAFEYSSIKYLFEKEWTELNGQIGNSARPFDVKSKSNFQAALVGVQIDEGFWKALSLVVTKNFKWAHTFDPETPLNRSLL